MPQTKTTTLPLRKGGDLPTAPHRSRSMVLQPEDVIALSAEEAAADIEDAVRSIAAENRNGKEPGKSGN